MQEVHSSRRELFSFHLVSKMPRLKIWGSSLFISQLLDLRKAKGRLVANSSTSLTGTARGAPTNHMAPRPGTRRPISRKPTRLFSYRLPLAPPSNLELAPLKHGFIGGLVLLAHGISALIDKRTIPALFMTPLTTSAESTNAWICRCIHHAIS